MSDSADKYQARSASKKTEGKKGKKGKTPTKGPLKGVPSSPTNVVAVLVIPATPNQVIPVKMPPSF